MKPLMLLLCAWGLWALPSHAMSSAPPYAFRLLIPPYVGAGAQYLPYVFWQEVATYATYPECAVQLWLAGKPGLRPTPESKDDPALWPVDARRLSQGQCVPLR